MDITKLLKGSDPLIVAPELYRSLQKNVQNIFAMLARCLDQGQTAGNTVTCQAIFLAYLFKDLWTNLRNTNSYK